MHVVSKYADPVSMLLVSIQDNSVRLPEVDAHVGSLEHYHLRFGYLGYNTFKRMTQDQASGIKLTLYVRSVA